MWGALSDERTGLSFKIADATRWRSHSPVRVPLTDDHILLSQIRDSPNLEGQAPAFISPGNRVAQLYPQVLGFLSSPPTTRRALMEVFAGAPSLPSNYSSLCNPGGQYRNHRFQQLLCCCVSIRSRGYVFSESFLGQDVSSHAALLILSLCVRLFYLLPSATFLFRYVIHTLTFSPFRSHSSSYRI
jgi:hypothetical protein